MMKNVDYGFLSNIEVTTGMLAAMRRTNRLMEWLKEGSRDKDGIVTVDPSLLLDHVMNPLKKKGLSFDFGDRNIIDTDGWKIIENNRMTAEEFKDKVENVLVIYCINCIDAYGMAEDIGKNGRFASLDSSATSYPGLTISRDDVILSVGAGDGNGR